MFYYLILFFIVLIYKNGKRYVRYDLYVYKLRINYSVCTFLSSEIDLDRKPTPAIEDMSPLLYLARHELKYILNVFFSQCDCATNSFIYFLYINFV